jgi:hypothetical protein
MATAIALLVFAASCATRDFVTVTDATTAMPIANARVMPIYCSFGGAGYATDANGIVHKTGFGIPRGGYGVQVEAQGYVTRFISTGGTSRNPSGWRGDNMNVALEPTTQP